MDYKQIKSYTSGRGDVVSCVDENAIAILDVGCSNGRLGEELLKQKPLRCVMGIEYDSNFCLEAENRLDSVIQSDINHFNWASHYEPEMFDCIIFADILEHLHDPWMVLRNAVSKLKPEGEIVISIPNIRHITTFYSIYLQGSFPRRSRGIFDSSHLRWFTLSDGIQLCKQANLQVEKIVSRPRIFDSPNSRINTFVDKHCSTIASLRPIREFLAYQFILVARKANG